jgi:hypothetical protein
MVQTSSQSSMSLSNSRHVCLGAELFMEPRVAIPALQEAENKRNLVEAVMMVEIGSSPSHTFIKYSVIHVPETFVTFSIL